MDGYGYDQPTDRTVMGCNNHHTQFHQQSYQLNDRPDDEKTSINLYEQRPCTFLKPSTGKFTVSFAPKVVEETQPVSSTVYFAQPPTYLGLSIITCMCCFWPLGIAATCYSCGSANAADRMDFTKAKSDGRLAKKLAIAAVVCGVIMYIIFVVLIHRYLVTDK